MSQQRFRQPHEPSIHSHGRAGENRGDHVPAAYNALASLRLRLFETQAYSPTQDYITPLQDKTQPITTFWTPVVLCSGDGSG